MTSKRETSESSVQRSALKNLCSNLAVGLHAAAQPLTILRANLDRCQSDRRIVSESRELVEDSVMEVMQLCTLFKCMRELVIAESDEPELSAMPILPLLVRVMDGVNLLYIKDGMLLSLMMPDTCQPVLIDRERTLDALTTVLLIAHGMSRAQDTIELIASSRSAKVVQVIVRNVKSYAPEMNAEASLGMALAESNIRSQKAKFSLSLQPFSVQIGLRKAPFTN